MKINNVDKSIAVSITERMARFFASAPDDEVFKSTQLIEKLGVKDISSCVRMRTRFPLNVYISEGNKPILFWGSKKAIVNLKRHLGIKV